MACSVQDQAAAMADDHIPEWASLDLSTCYDLTLVLDLDDNAYEGSAQITYVNLTGSQLTDIVLRTYPNADRIYGGNLTIFEAMVNGDLVVREVFLEDNTALRLHLNSPLLVGETARIELEFTGHYTRNFGEFGAYGIFNYVSAEQVLTLANWYPMVAPRVDGRWNVEPVIGIGDAVVSEAALYQVRVTPPFGWQVIATGSEVLQEPNDSRTTWDFVSGPVRDFVIIAGPDFVLRKANVDGISVRHWGLIDGQARWDEALQATIDSLTLFSVRYGPYPYSEIDVVAVPLQIAAGVEYPGVFLIDDSQYKTNDQSPFLLGVVVAHEVAHQWWYGVVGNNVLTDPWQDEALATFSSLLYQQQYQPRYYSGTLRFYRERVSEMGGAPDDTAIDQPLEAFRNQPNQYSPIVYTKGALFFVELRDRLGDQTFFDALQSYYALNQYQIATPKELLSAFETACTCELGEFYAQWGVGE